MEDAELQHSIDALSDEAAAAALAYVLDEEEPSIARRNELTADGAELPAMVASYGATPAADAAVDTGGADGELARSALRYLATVDEYRADVERGVQLPATVLHREPITIGLVAGLVFLVLSRTGFKAKKNAKGERSWEFEYRPVPDKAMPGFIAVIKKVIGG